MGNPLKPGQGGDGNFASCSKKWNLDLQDRLGFYNVLWAAKTHLPPASSTYRAFSTELPNTLIKLTRPYQFCCIFTTKMMWLLMSQPHLPVMNGNNPQIRDRPRCSARGDVERGQLDLTSPGSDSGPPGKPLGSPRPSKFPARSLTADKDSPSLQKSHFSSHNHLTPDAVPESPWTTLATRPIQELCGIVFSFSGVRKEKQQCLCATVPVHVGVLAHSYQFFLFLVLIITRSM